MTPRTWVVQIRLGASHYTTVLTSERAGEALQTFAEVTLMPGDTKRVLRNGRVLHRYTQPAPAPVPVLEGALF